MRGSVLPRGSGWTYVVDVPRQPCVTCVEGHRTDLSHGATPKSCPVVGCDAPLGERGSRRRQLWKAGFPTRKAAEFAMRRHLVQLDQGADPYPTKITVDEWMTKWLASPHVTMLRPRTSTRYAQIVRDDVSPVIGSLLLTEVRRRHAGMVIDHCRARGLSPRSIAQTRAVLSTSFRRALDDELIDTNPVTGLRLEKVSRPNLVVPTPSQMADLLDTAHGTVWHTPILIAVNTGMRRSEVLGLRWRDADLDGQRLRVTESLQRIRDDAGSRLEFTPLKTDRARRDVAIGPTAVEALKAWRTDQVRRRLRLGTGWQDLDLVCDRGDGGPFDPDAFSAAFHRLAATAGLSTATRLHDIRHAVATLMLEKGTNPAIASAMLGHASEAFTMANYQHVRPNMTEAAAHVIEAALRR